MTAVDGRPDRPSSDNDQHPVGHGRMLRKEDPRFIRGKGRYVDDIAAARDAAPGDPAVAGRARPDRQHRHHAPRRRTRR